MQTITPIAATPTIRPPRNDWRNQDLGLIVFRGPHTMNWGNIYGSSKTGRPEGYESLRGAKIAASMLSRGDDKPAVAVLQGTEGRYYTQRLKYEADSYGMHMMHFENGWPVFPHSRKAVELVRDPNVDLRALYDGSRQLPLASDSQ